MIRPRRLIITTLIMLIIIIPDKEISEGNKLMFENNEITPLPALFSAAIEYGVIFIFSLFIICSY